ncbi:uncharacterized protein BCR38DRAFT_481626 [Pseudomassariella vexata]|uniref:Uncharacterized protein n=1 Tax=Pseudomassariella vexata TaxID=1141098 RepID=A0A1Y2EI75_9PEZI|nr:uncharacterized protein BCR38DRAFT_481626 [Pseudomassariella vexata]ORY70495.1 hypothetical protein BCR38DRAFT_481626 [Pseudomassariella vexata]
METRTTATPSPQNRPLTPLLVLLFIFLGAAGAWLLRIDPIQHDVPRNFQSVVASGKLEDGSQLKQHFTGLTVIYDTLANLVAAFAAGPTAVWAIFYQTLGGTAIIPLYYAAYEYTSRNDDYYQSGRALDLLSAKSILPATVLAYLIPTIAMYIPFQDPSITQNLIAFWQITPLRIGADRKYLNQIYYAAFVVTAVTHLVLVYICLTSNDPQTKLGYVFLPSKETLKDGVTMGLHYIFQWDFWGIAGSSLLWCWFVVFDVQRLLGSSSVCGVAQAGLVIGVMAVVLGPGAAMAAVWKWKEDKLVGIEEKALRKKN